MFLSANQKGFTFVETLVSVTILALVTVPFVGLFLNGSLAVANAGKQTVAVNLCSEKIEGIKGDGYDLIYAYYISEGRSPILEEQITGYASFTRRTRVRAENMPLPDQPSLEASFLRITVTVSWQDPKTERHVEMETFIAARR